MPPESSYSQDLPGYGHAQKWQKSEGMALTKMIRAGEQGKAELARIQKYCSAGHRGFIPMHRPEATREGDAAGTCRGWCWSSGCSMGARREGSWQLTTCCESPPHDLLLRNPQPSTPMCLHCLKTKRHTCVCHLFFHAHDSGLLFRKQHVAFYFCYIMF